ncbi:MAG: Cell division protein FtsK, partial [Micavibrio sp.]|nr:Cell division protein FtsK [Micavibrio sp.]
MVKFCCIAILALCKSHKHFSLLRILQNSTISLRLSAFPALFFLKQTDMARTRRYTRKKSGFFDALIPESLQAFIANRLVDGFGLVLALAGLALLVAMATYSPADPSMNTSGKPGVAIHNWMGGGGAWVADLLLQTIGLAGALFGIIIGFWGVRIIRRHPIRPLTLRLSLMIAATLLAAIAFARVPSFGWMVNPWMGGSGGTLMLDRISSLFGHEFHTTLALTSGMFALFALPFALAVSLGEWKVIGLNILAFTQSVAETVISMTGSFYDWVRHYSDPDYEAPVRKKAAAKAVKPRKAPAIVAKHEEAEEEEYEEEEEEEDEDDHPIKVVAPKKKAAKKSSGGRQGALALTANGEWELPPIELLQDLPANEADASLDSDALRKNAAMLKTVLEDFNIEGEITAIHPGPVVTLYELEPAPGTKTSRVISLADDIARSMSATSVRCAVIPGRNVIGIELPNKKRQMVSMREILESQDSTDSNAALPLNLGKDISGKPIIADLARMPHLLVAGTTGSGKSVAVNTMILSLLYRLPPEKCRFIMIDPKMLELSVYNDIPHLLSPVVTEPGKAVVALKWTVKEMEDRYRAMSKLGVRNIDGYNERLVEAKKKGEVLMRKVQTGFDSETSKPVYEEQPMDMTELPYIVVIVDEFADLMLVAGKDVENAIQRLAQMARAAGIHIIMATQRPSVDVITGVIKANFPTRISF